LGTKRGSFGMSALRLGVDQRRGDVGRGFEGHANPLGGVGGQWKARIRRDNPVAGLSTQ
jgi:hypothetical protein